MEKCFGIFAKDFDTHEVQETKPWGAHSKKRAKMRNPVKK
jgi:hypothetical protein